MRTPRRLLVLAAIALSCSACSVVGFADDDTSGDADVPPPLPTIGIGSETGDGRISGAADVRAIDTGEIESLVMIGDSITVGSDEALRALFESLGFADVEIAAQNSKRTSLDVDGNPAGATIAGFISDQEPAEPGSRLWVVALGTNDIGQYDDVEQVEDAIRELLSQIPDDAPLVWINTYIEGRPEGTDIVNAAIDSVVGSRDGSTVGRWDLVASEGGVLRSDGVHPNGDGALVFADLVARTVVDFLE